MSKKTKKEANKRNQKEHKRNDGPCGSRRARAPPSRRGRDTPPSAPGRPEWCPTIFRRPSDCVAFECRDTCTWARDGEGKKVNGSTDLAREEGNEDTGASDQTARALAGVRGIAQQRARATAAGAAHGRNVREPLNALLDARHRPGDDFSVEMVRESAVELALNRQLVREEADEAPRVLRRGDHDRLALRVELRPPGAAEDLHHVEHRNLHLSWE